MKRILKISLMLVIMLAMQFQINYVYADDVVEQSGYRVAELTEIINTNTYKPTSSEDDGELEEKAGIIVAAIRNIGIVVAVIALMAIGLKTMVLSAEEKAIYKQALPGYLLGVFMVIAITVIPSMIYNAVKDW